MQPSEIDALDLHMDLPNDFEAWQVVRNMLTKAYNRTEKEVSTACSLLHRLFSDRYGIPFGPHDLYQTTRHMKWVTADPGETLFEKLRDDDVSDNVFIVVHGCVKQMYLSVNGRLQRELIHGDVFGSTFDMVGLPTTTTYQAAELTDLLVLTQPQYASTIGKALESKTLENRLRTLRNLVVPILASWSDAELTALSKAVFSFTYPSRTVSVREEDLSDSLYFIVSGKMRVVREIDFTAATKGEPCAKLLDVATLNPGEYYGELGFLRINVDIDRRSRNPLAAIDPKQPLEVDDDANDSENEAWSFDAAASAREGTLIMQQPDCLKRQATVFAHTPAEVLVLTKDKFFSMFKGSAVTRMREYAKGYPSAGEIRAQFLKQQKWLTFKTDLLTNKIAAVTVTSTASTAAAGSGTKRASGTVSHASNSKGGTTRSTSSIRAGGSKY